MTFGVSRSTYGDLAHRSTYGDFILPYMARKRGSRYILNMTIYGHYGVRDVVKLTSMRSINDERVIPPTYKNTPSPSIKLLKTKYQRPNDEVNDYMQ